MPTVASGPNYSVDVDGSHAVVKIWRRTDLDFAAGAELAGEIVHALRRVLAIAKRITIDLRDAPPVGGPATLEAFTDFLRACADARVRVAVLVGSDAVQNLQVTRVAKEHAPEYVRPFADAASAAEWLSPHDSRVKR